MCDQVEETNGISNMPQKTNDLKSENFSDIGVQETQASNDIERDRTETTPESKLLVESNGNGVVKEDLECGCNNEQVSMSQTAVYKNLIVYSVSFAMLFSAFTSFQNIQSTVNIEGGLGTMGLTTLYVSMFLTSLFVSLVILPLLSYKTMTIVAMATFVCFLATGFYSNWYTVIPASVIIGFGSAHLWPTQQAYVTKLANIHAANTKSTAKDAYSLFFGIFFGVMQTSQIWGNLCSSLVFGTDNDVKNTSSVDPTMCGAAFCAAEAQENSTIIIPSQTKMNVYTGFCVGLSVLAVVVIVVLLTNIPSAPRKTNTNKPSKGKEICKKVSGVLKLIFKSWEQQLLIPATVLSGMSVAFLSADYTLAYVSCPLGVDSVGYVMITYGVVCSLASFMVGKVSSVIGTLSTMFIGFSAHLTALFIMLFWSPDPNRPIIVFVIAAVWGIGDSVYQPITMSLYSYYFSDRLETALSSYRALQCIGWALPFSYSSWICTDRKIYSVMTVITCAMICLVVLHCCKKKKKKAMTLEYESNK